jgi:hypothetical protein
VLHRQLETVANGADPLGVTRDPAQEMLHFDAGNCLIRSRVVLRIGPPRVSSHRLGGFGVALLGPRRAMGSAHGRHIGQCGRPQGCNVGIGKSQPNAQTFVGYLRQQQPNAAPARIDARLDQTAHQRTAQWTCRHGLQ